MPQSQKERPKDIGVFGMHRGPQSNPRLTIIEIVAIVLTVLWLGATLFGWGSAEGEEGQGTLLTVVVALLPVALIWVAATTARAIRSVREEANRLQTTIDAMRLAHVAQQQAAPVARAPSVMAGEPRTAERAPDGVFQDQPPLDEEAGAHDLSMQDLVRALDFPDSAEDVEGFRALRNALADPTAAKLVRAAQDVLTLLAEDGIYMDDLVPERAEPTLWRRLARGERGGALAAIGSVQNEEAVAAAADRLQQDPVFHDAAQHFLRSFERTLATFEPEATDEEVDALAATRTASAFMLLSQSGGTSV